MPTRCSSAPIRVPVLPSVEPAPRLEARPPGSDREGERRFAPPAACAAGVDGGALPAPGALRHGRRGRERTTCRERPRRLTSYERRDHDTGGSMGDDFYFGLEAPAG